MLIQVVMLQLCRALRAQILRSLHHKGALGRSLRLASTVLVGMTRRVLQTINGHHVILCALFVPLGVLSGWLLAFGCLRRLLAAKIQRLAHHFAYQCIRVRLRVGDTLVRLDCLLRLHANHVRGRRMDCREAVLTLKGPEAAFLVVA